MLFINKLKKFSFLFSTLAFALLGVLSANIFLTYLKFNIPLETTDLPKIKPIDLSLAVLQAPLEKNLAVTQMPDNLDSLPNIDFQMKLIGSIITEDENASVVVVEYNGKEKTLSLNDELDANLILIKLLPYRMVFDNNGKKQKYDWQEDKQNLVLTFQPGKDDKLDNGAMQPIESSAVNLDKTTMPEQKPIGTTASQRPATTTKTVISDNKKAKIQQASTKPLIEKFGDNYRSKLLKNPFQLAKYVRLSPVRRDSRLIGYAVYPASDKSLFKAFGLESGDVLLDVNGIPTNNPRRMGELMQMLSEASVLDIAIERKGNPITINLPL